MQPSDRIKHVHWQGLMLLKVKAFLHMKHLATETSATLVVTSATLVVTSATLVVTSTLLVVTSALLVVTKKLLITILIKFHFPQHQLWWHSSQPLGVSRGHSSAGME